MPHRIFYYLRHLLQATNTRGHGVQSPFLFRFIQNVIYDQHAYYFFEQIETARTQLKANNSVLTLTDYGTGSKDTRTISQLAKKSLKPAKLSQILFKSIRFIQAKNILELGTSLGITTAYLASASPNSKCTTLEGSDSIAKVADKNFEKLGLTHINIIRGNIDATLDEALADFEQLDFVFFDANHRKAPTINYFNKCIELIHDKTVFVFDDIYWSKGMCAAWETVKNHPKVTATFDLYELGILFFDSHFPHKHYKLKL